jgi:hypothetical protein
MQTKKGSGPAAIRVPWDCLQNDDIAGTCR